MEHSPAEGSRCWIGLGGNLGDLNAAFDAALRSLAKRPNVTVVRESRRFGTTPIGTSDTSRPNYLNSAAELQIKCTPETLLSHLQGIERDLGRVRGEYWGSRPLDLDLLLHESETRDTPELKVPHPHLWYRRFVLDPLIELAPEIRHPEREVTIRELWKRLQPRPLSCAFLGGTDAERGNIAAKLQAEFAPDVRILDLPGPANLNGEETFCLWLGPSGARSSQPDADYAALPLVNRFDLRTIPLPKAEAARQMLRAALG